MQATAGIANHEQGLASGLVNTSLQVGGALGLALATAVISANTGGATQGPALWTASSPRSPWSPRSRRSGWSWHSRAPGCGARAGPSWRSPPRRAEPAEEREAA